MTEEENPVPSGYDPNLPFFLEHRELVRRQAERAYRGQARAARRRELRLAMRRAIVRPARRALSLTAVLTLLGATAYALTSAHNGVTPSTSPTQFASDPGHRWAVSAWQRAGELCRDIALADAVQSRCALPPTGRELQTVTVDSPTRRYVFGLTARVRVTVHDGSSAREVRTRAPLTAGRGAGLPADVRWFVTSFARN